jgi:acetamidase/formamidase
MYHWEISEGLARITNLLGAKEVVIPVNPFLGCVATASEAPLSSMLAGDHGGNIDHADLGAGSSLCLPVSQAGGMLYVGDMHAAQGHGETTGGGLEISGSATIRVKLYKGLKLAGPRYETPDGIGCLGVGSDVADATRTALANMIRWLAGAGWNICDAQMLVSQTCSFRMGAAAEHYAVMSCFLPQSSLPRDFTPWP